MQPQVREEGGEKRAEKSGAEKRAKESAAEERVKKSEGDEEERMWNLAQAARDAMKAADQ